MQKVEKSLTAIQQCLSCRMMRVKVARPFICFGCHGTSFTEWEMDAEGRPTK